MSIIDSFREYVRRKEIIKSQTHLIWLCLKFIEDYPEYVLEVGIFWNTDSSFFAKSLIFCKFVGRKRDTFTKNLKHHFFTRIITTKHMRASIPPKFQNYGILEQHGWTEWRLEGFTKGISELKSIKWRYVRHLPKKEQEQEEEEEEAQDEIINNESPDINKFMNLFNDESDDFFRSEMPFVTYNGEIEWNIGNENEFEIPDSFQ